MINKKALPGSSFVMVLISSTMNQVYAVLLIGSKRMECRGKKKAGQNNLAGLLLEVGAKRFELVTPCL